MVKMNPDVNFYATGIQTIVKSGDCHGVSRLKCDNCNFCGEKTKVYTEAWNYLHVAVLNLDVKY